MIKSHTAKSFDEDLARLNRDIAKIGGNALKMCENALAAAHKASPSAALRVIKADDSVDELEREISIYALRIIATRQPLAVDLRTIVTAIRMASDFERVADCSINVARRTVSAKTQGTHPALMKRINRLGKAVVAMLKTSIRLHNKGEKDQIIALWESDKEIDEIYVSIFREGVSYMVEDPTSVSRVMLCIFLAKDLERMGDHITNVAEALYFRKSGKLLAAHRPKGELGDVESMPYPSKATSKAKNKAKGKTQNKAKGKTRGKAQG